MAPGGPLIVDIHASMISTHSDEKDGSADSTAVLALAQILAAARAVEPVLVRGDSAGATHAFTAAGIVFSVTMNHTPALARANGAVDAQAWQAAIDDGQPRENGEIRRTD